MIRQEPKVGDSIFKENGEYVTDIGAIICHSPFKVFGKDGGKYIVKQVIINHNYSQIILVE